MTRAIGAALILIGATGCQANVRCDPGLVVCRDEAVQRCVGPSEGGDADGEFSVVTDCAAMGQQCWIDVWEEGERGGCVTPACFEAHSLSTCHEVGLRKCTLSSLLFECRNGDDGCLVWELVTDCSDDGMVCSYTSGGAACQ
ncbi:MAG: hypothetical protein M5U28_01435 [Sandaracinaceae bacterium]|nr:hypothetical protein [Sandaracinaceae bacterium]